VNDYTLRNGHQLRVRRRWHETPVVPAARFIVYEVDDAGYHVGVPYVSLDEHGARAWAESAVRRGYGLAEHALPEDSPAFRRALAEADLTRRPTDDGLRCMIRVDQGDAFRRSGRSLATDPEPPVPESVKAQTEHELEIIGRVRANIRARREAEAAVVREAREGIAELADWLSGEEGAAS
jgi:hypothetical protein